MRLNPRQDPRLVDIEAAQVKWLPAAIRWASASGLPLVDVKQEIVLATLAKQDPAVVVPVALGVRPLGFGKSKRWVAKDPIAHQFEDVEEQADFLPGEDQQEENEELGIGGWEEVAKRLGVTRRRVQQLAKAQRARVVAGGDLFGGGI